MWSAGLYGTWVRNVVKRSDVCSVLGLLVAAVACEATELEVIQARGLSVPAVDSGTPSSGTASAPSEGVAEPTSSPPQQSAPEAPMLDASAASDASDAATAHGCAVADVETRTSYLLSLRTSGACLRDRGNAPTAESVVSTQAALCDAEQSAFQLQVTLQGDFTIYHPSTSRNLDVFGADVSLGTPLVLYTPLGWRHQRFRFNAEQDGYFFTISPVDDMGLCVSEVNGDIRLARCAGSEWQQWQLLQADCLGE